MLLMPCVPMCFRSPYLKTGWLQLMFGAQLRKPVLGPVSGNGRLAMGKAKRGNLQKGTPQ